MAVTTFTLKVAAKEIVGVTPEWARLLIRTNFNGPINFAGADGTWMPGGWYSVPADGLSLTLPHTNVSGAQPADCRFWAWLEVAVPGEDAKVWGPYEIDAPVGTTTVWLNDAGPATNVPADWRDPFRDEMAGKVTEAEAIRDEVQGYVIGELGTTDSQTATLVATPGTLTGTALNAAIGDKVATAKEPMEFLVGDYASPQAAVTAAQATGKAAVVKFGRGNFTWSTTLAVTASDIHLDLGEAKITTSSAGPAITFTGTSGSPLARVGVRGGFINMDSTTTTAVSFSYCTDPVVEGGRYSTGSTSDGGAIRFSNCTGALARGVRAHSLGSGVALTASPNSSVVNCVFTSMKRDGITVYNGSHRSTVAGCTVVGFCTSGDPGRSGIHAYGSNQVTVSGNVVDSAGVVVSDDSPKIRFRDCLEFACTGNFVTGDSSAGITVVALADIGSGAGLGTISGNTIRNVQVAGINIMTTGAATTTSLFPVAINGNFIKGVRLRGSNDGVGIDVKAAADSAAVVGNYIEDVDGSGISMGATGTVTGNVVRQCGKGSLGAKAGVFAFTAGSLVVTGNHVYDDATVPTMVNSFRVVAGTTARTAGNLFQGGTSAVVRNDGTIDAQVGDIDTAKVGFFGKAPVSRPSGTPAAATDAATTQALVNSLRTSLLALGLISS